MHDKNTLLMELENTLKEMEESSSGVLEQQLNQYRQQLSTGINRVKLGSNLKPSLMLLRYV